jgi:hypothetical protein
MNRLWLLLWFSLFGQMTAAAQNTSTAHYRPPDKSPYFAFVDRDYIFTVEVVEPGVVLLNFVSMTDQDVVLPAKNIRFTLENRKAVAKLLSIETGTAGQPMLLPTLTIHPRSSFGVKIEADFGDIQELHGVTIRIGAEDLRLAALDSFDFESLVLKVNRINLGSPDFSEDWQVLKMSTLGSKAPAAKK